MFNTYKMSRGKSVLNEAKPQTDTCPRANGETSLEPQISQIAQII